MPKRGSIATVACEPCRRRKTRCDGERPTCSACQKRAIVCAYAIEPNITRTAALKDKVQQLETSYGNLADLYWQLKHGSPEDVTRLVERIRSDEDVFAGQLDGDDLHQQGSTPMRQPLHNPQDIMDMEDVRRTVTPLSSVAASYLTHDYQSERQSRGPMLLDPALRDVDPAHAASDVSNRTNADSTTAHMAQESGYTSMPKEQWHASAEDSVDSKAFELDSRDSVVMSLKSHADSIRSAFAIQVRVLSDVFVLHDEARLEELLSAVNTAPPSQLSNAQLCELSGLAAVCSQCCREMFDTVAVETYYDAAKYFLEDCIEDDITCGAQVCGDLSLYNMQSRATLCLAYADLGLSLLSTFNNPLELEALPATQEQSPQAMSTYRTLIIAKSWVESVLGHTTLDNEPIKVPAEPGSQQSPQFIRTSTADIVILKAKCSRMLWVCPDGPQLLPTIEKVKTSLNKWYEGMPRHAQLERSISDPEHPVKDSIFFLHAFHMNILMCTFRRALQGFRDPAAREKLSHEEATTLNRALHDGIVAAEQSARLLALLLNEARTPRHCWLAIFQTYVCSSVLLYKAMQLKLFGRSSEDWEHTIDLAKKALAVLDTCRSMAPVAQIFASKMHSHMQAFEAAPEAHLPRGLSAHVYSRASLMSSSQQQPSHYLFVRPTDGDAGLYRASCELFDTVCRPISQHDRTAPQSPPVYASHWTDTPGTSSLQAQWPLPSWPYLLGTGHAAEQLLSQTPSSAMKPMK